MNWKSVVKGLVPPLALDLLRNSRRRIDPHHIWEGIYEHYKDVPSDGPGFEGDVWADSTRNAVAALLATRKHGSAIRANLIGENILLLFLISIICRDLRSIRILDFGGGLGESYIDLGTWLDDCCSVDYHIVETPRMCEQGTALFKDDHQIHFHSSLPADLPGVDVIYISSALQYVEDYVGLLQKLCAYNPRFTLFVKLSSGDIPTYATAQKNVRGSTIPYWFINIHSLIQIMRDAGYSLIFKSILEREYDQDNFPQEYRLRRACNLLFRQSVTRDQ